MSSSNIWKLDPSKLPLPNPDLEAWMKQQVEQKQLLDAALAELRRLQWPEDMNGNLFCASCMRQYDEGHAEHCTLAAILARAGDQS